MIPRTRALAAASALAALLLAGCGGDQSGDDGNGGNAPDAVAGAGDAADAGDAGEDVDGADSGPADTDDDPDLDAVNAELEQAQAELDELMEEYHEEFGDSSELPGGFGSVPLQVGDCWGIESDIDFDPRPCSQAHIYEVNAVIDDFDPADYAEPGYEDLGGFEQGQAEYEARISACEAAFAGYFGYPHDTDHGIAYEPTPEHGIPDLVVCSAHSSPDVEFYRDEVEGSLEDRGFIQ